MNTSTIDPLTLPSLPLAERSQLPNCPAIYFVLAEERILYIGKTSNLSQRWIAHHRFSQVAARGNSVKIAWLDISNCTSDLLTEIESALIEHFSPELNRTRYEKKPTVNGIKTQNINFTCESEDKEYLREWAAREGRTLSNLVERIIKEAIVKDEQRQKSPSPKKSKGAA